MIFENRAWQFISKGKELVCKIKSINTLKAGQIVVKNLYAGINPVDWKFINNNPMNWSEGHIPGVDGVGVVVGIADDVSTELLDKIVAYHCSLTNDGSFGTYTVLYANKVMLVPEGGERGGEIIAQGTPEILVNNKRSYTARFLKKYIK